MTKCYNLINHYSRIVYAVQKKKKKKKKKEKKKRKAEPMVLLLVLWTFQCIEVQVPIECTIVGKNPKYDTCAFSYRCHILYSSCHCDSAIKLSQAVFFNYLVFIKLFLFLIVMLGSRKIRQGKGGCGPEFDLFSHQHISQRSKRTSLEKSNCFSMGSVPVFLRKHISIATCDFPGGPDTLPPLDPPMIVG